MISCLADWQKSKSWIWITHSIDEAVKKQALLRIANETAKWQTPYGGKFGNI